jgi:hypothetical protein
MLIVPGALIMRFLTLITTLAKECFRIACKTHARHDALLHAHATEIRYSYRLYLHPSPAGVLDNLVNPGSKHVMNAKSLVTSEKYTRAIFFDCTWQEVGVARSIPRQVVQEKSAMI